MNRIVAYSKLKQYVRKEQGVVVNMVPSILCFPTTGIKTVSQGRRIHFRLNKCKQRIILDCMSDLSLKIEFLILPYKWLFLPFFSNANNQNVAPIHERPSWRGGCRSFELDSQRDYTEDGRSNTRKLDFFTRCVPKIWGFLHQACTKNWDFHSVWLFLKCGQKRGKFSFLSNESVQRFFFFNQCVQKFGFSLKVYRNFVSFNKCVLKIRLFYPTFSKNRAFHQKIGSFAQCVPKWQYWFESDRIGFNLAELVRIWQNWFESGRIGSNLAELVRIW